MIVMNKDLLEYLIRLADSSLIAGHRLSEWCGHGPILEEDIAMTNIALDLIGQSRLFYEYACETEGKGRNEDDFAYHRNEREFKNFLLVEQPNGDFAQTMLKHFLFSACQLFLFTELKKSADKKLSALAEKSLKEVAYHLRHSSEWMKRLGDGTEESNQRLKNAVDNLWRYTDDLFDADETEENLRQKKITPDMSQLKSSWENKVKEVFSQSNIPYPENVFMITGSRKGIHSEHLGYILAEMQSLARAHPDAKW